MKSVPKPKVVSLFAGAGGLDLGFAQAGFEIIWANDIDSDSVDTYRQNLGDHIVLGDIQEVDSDDIPYADVVLGGFPCQGFSRANRFRSVEDSRNALYLEFVRVVKDKQPRCFIAENVRGILSLDGGNVIQMIVEDFEKVGYEVEYKLFNLADFGVPQQRRRVIIMGTRKDVAEKSKPRFPEPTHTNKVDLFDLERWKSIGEALAGIPDPDLAQGELPNHVYSKYKVEFRDFTGHRPTDPSKPSPTILARGNGGGGVCAIPHPNGKRRLSVRESASVQTFPLDFEFTGSLNSMYRQIGNAVPVLFARLLAESVLEAFETTEVHA
ncbi:MAG: DNA cytosine methyltransferase [Rhodothermales bacterium]